MSIEPFKRIYWIVLDGMGIEHARFFLGAESFPGLSKFEREGILAASMPSSPACQTPTALLTLFSGAEPRESGVWGYHMPDPRRPTRSISGFVAPTKEIRTIWDELGARGCAFSLMNVAFRNDRVWMGRTRGLDFGYDGYRRWKKSHVFLVSRRSSRVRWQGIEITLVPKRNGVQIRKGGRARAELLPGVWRTVELTRSLRAYACLLDQSHLALAPLTRPLVRGAFPPHAAGEDFVDFNVHRAVRRLNRGRDERLKIPISVEMAPVELGMKQKESLMIDAIRGTPSRVVIGYFPLVDEINHACFDLLDSPHPDPRTRELFLSCAHLVDGLVSRVMREADRDTLVVLSSDHGVSAFRSCLHVNEVLAQTGLVARSGQGYDLRRSRAYYHPSDCGIVLARPWAGGGAVLTGIRRAVDRARDQLGVRIGIEEGRPDDPFIAFLYPLSDSYLTARAPRRGGEILDRTRSGGQHLSPLAATPWIQAMLGLWTPRTTTLSRELDAVPSANRMMKSFLLGMLEGA
ncbi:MAG: alkaline phosphatase family protein [Spirochaetia bacterium]